MSKFKFKRDPLAEPIHPSTKLSPIRQVFRAIGRALAFTRVFLLNVFVVLLVIVILAALVSGDEPEPVPREGVLVLNPMGSIVEQPAQTDPFSGFIGFGSSPIQTSIQDILDAIDHARSDDRIKLLLLDFSRVLAVDFAQIERIHKAITEFKDAGKPVWSHAGSYSQSQYVMSLPAEELYMDPLGQLVFTGVSIATQYYKGLLDTLEVEVNVLSKGDFKSAIEPYTRSSKSEHVKAAQQKLVNTLWDQLVKSIASARDLDEHIVRDYAERVHEMGDAATTSIAALPVQAGFIDELLETELLDNRLKETVSQDVKRINLSTYLEHVDKRSVSSGDSSIAVIVIEGEILGLGTLISGEASPWVKQIQQVTSDESIAALVVRVNSPGGSVVESEALRRALREFKKTDRPLVVSMAGVAASGGYWLATPADHITATPTTLTGSIGVFALQPNVERALGNFGVHTDAVTTTPYAAQNSFLTSPTKELMAFRQRQVSDIYERFVGLVMSSRNKPIEDMDALAQGRVWLGDEAMHLGLVDQIGDFDVAIEKAAELAEVETYHIEYIQSPQSFFDSFESFVQDTSKRVLSFVGADTQLQQVVTQQLRYVQDPTNIYARCTDCFVNIN